jgi:hypothetical protein
VPLPGTWSHWGKMMMGAAAAVAFVVLSVVQAGPVSVKDEPRGRDALVNALGEAWCEDPSRAAVDALEASVGACLVATPLISTR